MVAFNLFVQLVAFGLECGRAPDACYRISARDEHCVLQVLFQYLRLFFETVFFFEADDAHDKGICVAAVACDFEAVVLGLPVDVGGEGNHV